MPTNQLADPSGEPWHRPNPPENPPVAADMKVYVVSATRRPAAEFQSHTALGRSLARIAHDPRLVVQCATDNSRSLALVYNEILDQLPESGIVVFVHDDVWLDDYYLIQRVLEGLETYDVIGLAGSRRRLPGQQAWLFPNLQSARDEPRHLSGVVAHGAHAGGEVARYGDVPAACELLDGVFLAARTATLKQRDVRFDPRFDFHMYDMDFCRTARQQGLRLGTWPICITHQGNTSGFLTEDWKRNYAIYLAKWGD